MIVNLKSQQQLDVINEILNSNPDDLSIKKAEMYVAEIAKVLPYEFRLEFMREWGKQHAAALPVADSSIRAASGADVAMLFYAIRFFTFVLKEEPISLEV